MNNIDKDYSFNVVNHLGIEVTCDTLAVLNLENSEPIIIFTDYTLDKDNKFNVYVSKIIKNDEGFKLETIDDYKAIPEVNQELRKIWSELNSK